MNTLAHLSRPRPWRAKHTRKPRTARDLAVAVACALALFALPPVFRLANRARAPEAYVLRDVATLTLPPAQPPPPPSVDPERAEDRPADSRPLVMPSPAVAHAPPPPLLTDWSPPLPSLFGSSLAAFPVAEWTPGDLVFDQDEVDSPPRPLAQPPPRYPPMALRAGLEGHVDIEAVVLADGRIERIRVVDETPRSVFAQAAIAAVGRWRFEPARHRDHPVNARIRVTVEFKLDR